MLNIFTDAVCDKANELFTKGEYENALQSIERCIQVLRRTSFSRTEGDETKTQLTLAKLLEARILLALGQENEAEQKFDQIKSSLIGNDERTYFLRGKLYYYLAEISKNAGNQLDETMELLNKSKSNFIKGNAPQEVVQILFELKSYPNFKNDREKLLETSEEIEEFNKKIKDKNTRILNSALNYLNKGRLLSFIDQKQSYAAFRSANSEFKKLGLSNLELKSLFEFIFIKSNNELKTSLNEFKRLLDKIDKSSQSDLYAETLTKITELSIKLGEVQKIEEDIQQILGELRETPKSLETGDLLLDLAKSIILFTDKSNESMFQLAIDTIQNARDHYDNENDKIGKAASYILEALAEYELDHNDAANSKLQLVKVLTKNMSDETNVVSRSPWKYDFMHSLTQSQEIKFVSKEILGKYNPKQSVYGVEILHLLSKYKNVIGNKEEANAYAEECANLYRNYSKMSPTFKQLSTKLS